MNINSHIDKLNHTLHTAQERVKRENLFVHKAQQNVRNTEKAQSIIQTVAQTIQQQAHAQIAGIVTLCLQSVFGKDYEFHIHFDCKRGRTEAALVLTKNGLVVEDPINEDSGGVVSIAAFALRLACLILARPRLRKLLVLDEPFSQLSAQYRPAVKAMILKLAKDFKVQFIIVTHQQELMCGKIVRISS